MSFYEELKNYVGNYFENFKSIATEEIVNYYGEQYRDQIVSRINNTSFAFYINYSRKLKTKKDLLFISEYYKLIKKYMEKNNMSKEIYNSTGIIFPMAKILIDDNTPDFSYCYNQDKKSVDKVIYIPLFFTNDEGIIHEMIHSCMSNPLLLIGDKNGRVVKCKNGINVLKHEGENLLEECLTQMDAHEIAKRLKAKNVSFINKYYPHNELICFYNQFIPYVSNFYDEFKEEIIDARLTLNIRGFIDSIGKDNYIRYIDLIKDFLYNYNNTEKGYYKYFLDSELDKMKKSKCKTLSKN